MKKHLFIVIGLLVLSVTNYAQVSHSFFLKAVAGSVRGTYGETWSDWESTSILIYFDLDNETITIDNKFEDKFYVRTWSEPEMSEDEEGDVYDYITISAIDKDGIICTLFYATYRESPHKILAIAYTNIQYRYSCRFIE